MTENSLSVPQSWFRESVITLDFHLSFDMGLNFVLTVKLSFVTKNESMKCKRSWNNKHQNYQSVEMKLDSFW